MRATGLSKARLGRLHDVLQGYVERGDVAGVVAAVSRRDEVLVEATGARTAGDRDPIRRDTIFRIASMTKPVTAVAAMILVEEGRLRLDEPVERWLPELADRQVLRAIDGPLDDTVPAARSITPRDLLTFRSGLGLIMAGGPYPIQAAIAEAGLGPAPTPPPLDPDELIARFARLPLMCQPGTRWLYHSAYEILAVLIARAAGIGFEEFLRQRIFGPLGMEDTSFVVPEDKRGRLAGCQRIDAGGRLVAYEDERGGRSGRHAVAPSGGSGLVSTIDDYLAFGTMMLDRGCYGPERILARPTVLAMTTDQLTSGQKAASPFFPGFWDNRGWGFGVSMITQCDGIASVPGRFGWDGGFGTSWCSDPQEDLVGVLMIQRLFDPVTVDLITDFWTLAYQAIDD